MGPFQDLMAEATRQLGKRTGPGHSSPSAVAWMQDRASGFMFLTHGWKDRVKREREKKRDLVRVEGILPSGVTPGSGGLSTPGMEPQLLPASGTTPQMSTCPPAAPGLQCCNCTQVFLIISGPIISL